MADQATHFIQELDKLIRVGNTETARTKLRQLKTQDIPNHQLRDFAILARRIYEPHLALNWLNPIVRPKAKDGEDASPADKAEYARALTQIGATDEAFELLRKLNAKDYSEIPLFLAFAHFSVWEYASSLPYLEAYLAQKTLSPYQRAIGTVNFAQALVHEQDERALTTLQQFLGDPKSNEWVRLKNHAHRNLVEYHLIKKDGKAAELSLKQAQDFAKKSGIRDDLFFQKCFALLTLLKEPGQRAFELVDKVKEDAIKVSNWEIVRSCDYYKSIAKADKEMLLQLYFGTRYGSFRAGLLDEALKEEEIPNLYSWKGNASNRELKFSIDLNTGLESVSKGVLVPGKLPHRLFSCLASDFYRPFRIAEIHTHIYPGEHFNPQSSTQKVYVAIGRLKKFLEENRIPLSIGESGGEYQIHMIPEGNIQVPKPGGPIKESDGKWIETIRERLGAQSHFSAREVSEILGLSRWSALKLIEKANSQGSIATLGSGKGKDARYQFSQSAQKSQKAS